MFSWTQNGQRAALAVLERVWIILLARSGVCFVVGSRAEGLWGEDSVHVGPALFACSSAPPLLLAL